MLYMGKRVEMPSGSVFTEWVVVCEGDPSASGCRRFVCKCSCGNTSLVRLTDLRMGKSTRCRSCSATIKHTTHGLATHRLYPCWVSMKERCYQHRYVGYHNYGGRGIKVCDRWLNSFPNFLEDMGDKPTDKHSLDRIDNEGNYEPSNCRWSTYLEQANNRRVRGTSVSGVNGVAKSPTGVWVARIQVQGSEIYLGRDEDKEEAINLRRFGDDYKEMLMDIEEVSYE